MLASELSRCAYLIENFGESRVYETVRRLRELGHIPKGRQEIDPGQLSLLLYCLCCSNALKDVAQCVLRYKMLINKGGCSFASDFTFLLESESELKDVRKIYFYKKTGKVALFLHSDEGECLLYLPGGLPTTTEAATTQGVESMVAVTGEWLMVLWQVCQSIVKLSTDIQIHQNLN